MKKILKIIGFAIGGFLLLIIIMTVAIINTPEQRAARDSIDAVYQAYNDSIQAYNDSIAALPKPKVVNSEWDGSVSQAKKALKSALNDPDSYESISWGKVMWLTDTISGREFYRVYHKYRAKNGFGGYVTSNIMFEFDSLGNVTLMQ